MKLEANETPDRVEDLALTTADRGETSLAAVGLGRPPGVRARGRWILVVCLACAISGIGVGTAAALGWLSAPPSDRRIAHCYTTAALGDPSNVLDVSVAANGANPTIPDAARTAMDICSGAWLQGRLSATDPKVSLDPQPPPWDRPIPQLVACVLASGELGILPGQESTCNQLGLAVAEI